ncbi:DNA cytosine methyltransferase [Staphylothermus hellenicus]|uniref:DNA (cytosine-5-)-methyltransferase n=1 Tax=Staphylothermus hellenicus (strain DSM 12710 / JCM 10830 / BK20S6-10-b1 / P8) TaxID=591019 RepID=D7DA38_STAHD|nr:DNA cytosine methyltransferase [Staphylothermus hellenicus]ADI32634.1 DNA-cytosine methyltransferase [Staphylothermus hellenicus DSM 12710]
MKNTYKFIDLFCGAGGFAEGFILTNRFRSILGIDNFRPAAQTYKINFPDSIVVMEDIKRIRNDDLIEIVDPEEIDVVIGSPPCEPFTGANPKREKNPIDRLYKDPAGQLTLHYIRIVGFLKPRVFVMENVPAIMDDGLEYVLRKEFEKIGYRIYFNVLRAENYGTPSHRLRVFISNIPIKPKKQKHRITVGEAFRDLPEPGTDYPPNHNPSPLPLRKLKRISRLKWGEAMIYYEGARRRLPNLIRLNPNKIAPTVLGSSRFIHPYENRLITVREQARLMGFPDTFVFVGGRDEQYNLVGEAVPVPLAKAIAEYIVEKLDRGDI